MHIPPGIFISRKTTFYPKMHYRNGITRSNHQRCSIKKVVLKNFAVFTGKHRGWGLFLIKLQVFREVITPKVIGTITICVKVTMPAQRFSSSDWPLLQILITHMTDVLQLTPKMYPVNTMIAERFSETGPFMHLSNHVFRSQ